MPFSMAQGEKAGLQWSHHALSKKFLTPGYLLAPLEVSNLGLSTAYPQPHSPMEDFFPTLFDKCLTQAVEKIALFPHYCQVTERGLARTDSPHQPVLTSQNKTGNLGNQRLLCSSDGQA